MKCIPVGLALRIQHWSRRARLFAAVGALVTGAVGALAQDLAVTTVVSSGLNNPYGVAADSNGNTYIADTTNHVIRKVTSAGAISTLAGAVGTAGFVSNANPTVARFSSPRGIAIKGDGTTLYIADTDNNAIRVITLSGIGGTVTNVTTLAGTSAAGSANAGASSTFNGPRGVALNPAEDKLYVSDTLNHVIREIVLAGPTVSTLAGLVGNTTFANGDSATATFNYPWGIAVNAAGTAVFVADHVNHRIRRIALSPVAVTTYAGTGTAGATNHATGTSAQFSSPAGLAVDSSDNLFVGDFGNNALRMVAATGSNAVTTPAGGSSGATDGTGSAAKFFGPTGVAVKTISSVQTVFITDTNNQRLRKAVVPTVAGTAPSFPTSSVTFNAVVNQAASFSNSASGTAPITYSTTSSTGIFAVDPNTGAITSTSNPTSSADSVTFTVTATNSVSTATRTVTINVTLVAGPTINTHPQSVALSSGATTASFSVSATASPAITSYKWERQVNGLGSFNALTDGNSGGINFSGTATATLSISGITPLMNGDQYRVVVSNGTPTTSNPATLTVAPGFTSLSSTSFAVDQGSTFFVQATGTPSPTITHTGGTLPTGVDFVSGSGTASLSGTPTTTGSFPLTFTATNSGGASSQSFTLNVLSPQAPTITSASSATFTMNQPGSFTFQGSGVPSPTFTLYGASLPPGLTFVSPVLSGTPTSADNSPITFQVVAQNSSGTSAIQTFTLTILGVAPTITSHPSNATTNAGGTATFTATATGSPTPTVRWQRQPGGTVGFVDLVESTTFTGTKTTTLTITNAEAFMNGDQFRMVATTNANLSTNSQAAILTVNIGTTFTTFAGVAQFSGSNDGVGVSARFNSPTGLTTDFSGNVYIADTANHIIRKMTPAGVVTTLAGQPGVAGSADGVGILARFNSPQGVAVDSIGNVYVADTFNHTIRVIASDGTVSTIAGSPGSSGAVNDVGAAARFALPIGIVVDNAGSMFVADSGNHAIRQVLSNRSVSTFAGALGSAGSTDDVGTSARFNAPTGLARDSSGTLYVADTSNHVIRRISSSGSVATLAGVAGIAGVADGDAGTARFNRPSGVAVDLSGNVYVADTFSSTLRKITATGETSTLAGLPGFTGTADGVGSQARFNQPIGVAVDPSGNIYVADTRNHTIRRSGTPTAAQITVQPTSRTAGLGGTITFTVTATGAPAPGYQWQRQPVNTFGFTNLPNDATYSGVNTRTLTITNVTQAMDGDQFRVVVNNGVPPAAESSAVTLSVGVAPVFTSSTIASFQAQRPGTFTVTVNSTPAATFSATGLPSWASIDPNTGQISGTPPDTSGSPFVVIVSANNGVTATQTLMLTVSSAPPSIATQPASVTVDHGQTATFSVTVSGTPPFSYQWLKNGAAIGGANSATLQLANVQPGAEGVYSVAVSNSVGNTVSNGATLSVNSLPTITSQPGPQVALAGTLATFNVTASGGALNYQWRKNGIPIAGANAASLTVSGLTAADAGNYDVQVSNGFGLVNSSLAQLTVVSAATAPIITLQPAARSVVTGGSTTFLVAATAAPGPGYQWRKNGAVIPGANNASYVIPSVQAGDAANYDVIVSNAAGSVTSAPAGLTVLSRSFGGYYFGTFGNGDFAIYVRDDNTGVFLSFLPSSNTPVMTLNLSVNNAGQFSFAHGAYTIGGTLNANGTLSGSIVGPFSGTFVGERAAGTGGSQGVAGFYQAGAPASAATAYTIVAPNNVAFVLVQAGALADGGRGAVTNGGAVTLTTSRSIVSETITPSSGSLTGTWTGPASVTFNGAVESALARQRLVNISSRARVASGDAVAIAGFVISGEQSKPVLIRAVGPTLSAAPFNVSGALASPQLELYQGNTRLAVNSGISGNRAAIDAAGQQAGAFALGAAGTDAAILTTLAPGLYTAVVSSTTNSAGVALVEVYDLSGIAPGQKMLNIATRAAAGTGENTLIAGFVVPPGPSKRVLVRGVGPGLTPLGVTGVLAQPVLTLFRDSTQVATNTNWTTSADSAEITSASRQAGAFSLANNDSAMVVTLAPGNYSAQVVGVGNGTGVALIEVYELP